MLRAFSPNPNHTFAGPVTVIVAFFAEVSRERARLVLAMLEDT
jgi:hypothetical protein